MSSSIIFTSISSSGLPASQEARQKRSEHGWCFGSEFTCIPTTKLFDTNCVISLPSVRLISLDPVVSVLLPGRHLVTVVAAPCFRWHMVHNSFSNLQKLADRNLGVNRVLSLTWHLPMQDHWQRKRSSSEISLNSRKLDFIFSRSSTSGHHDVESAGFSELLFLCIPRIIGKSEGLPLKKATRNVYHTKQDACHYSMIHPSAVWEKI